MIALTDSESRACGLLYEAGRQASRLSVAVQLNVRMGKTSDLSDFKSGMIVGARCAGSSISETAGLLGFSHTTVSRVYPRMEQQTKNIQSVPVLWAKTAN